MSEQYVGDACGVTVTLAASATESIVIDGKELKPGETITAKLLLAASEANRLRAENSALRDRIALLEPVAWVDPQLRAENSALTVTNGLLRDRIGELEALALRHGWTK